jgi:outer membrane usher protein
VGVTDRSGKLVVPGLVSYNENQLAIEPADVPLNYSTPVTERYVSPPYRGGAVVRFEAKKFQAVTGRLFFVEGGVRTPAEYAGLQVTVDGATVESVVGQGGEFYLENLPEGSYAARVLLDKREASFTLVVPRSAQALVDLGDIDCPVQEGG